MHFGELNEDASTLRSFISTVRPPSTHRHENAAFRKHFLNGKNFKMHALRVEGQHFEKTAFRKR